MPDRVHVLGTSLRIRLFALQFRFDDALKEIEKVLNEETPGLEVACKISTFALDELYRAITSKTNTSNEVYF